VFQGITAATTPTGSRRSMVLKPVGPTVSSSQPNRSAARRYAAVCSETAVCRDWANQAGVPFSAVISAAISPARAACSSSNRATSARRSSGRMVGQGPLSNALRAAATAASTSAEAAWAAWPTNELSCGERISIRSSSVGATQRPPMYSCS
jgi:hypothetical protein